MENKDFVFCYFSLTGNTKKIADKLSDIFPSIEIIPNLKLDKKFILISSSIRFGEIPIEIQNFLEVNNKNMIAVIGSGNRIWGYSYCAGAKSIAKDYNVKYLGSIELAGTQLAIKELKEAINEWLKDAF